MKYRNENKHIRSNLVAAFGLFVAMFVMFPGNISRAESGQKPEKSLRMIAKLNQGENPDQFAKEVGARSRFTYKNVFSGGSFDVPVKRLDGALENKQVKKMSMDTFFQPASTPSNREDILQKEQDYRRYMDMLRLDQEQIQDLPIDETKVGVIDTIMNVSRFREFDTPSSVQQLPYVREEKLQTVLNEIDSEKRKALRRHGTFTARLIAGPKNTGVAPGVNLHFFSTIRAVALHANSFQPGRMHMEGVLGGLDWFASPSTPHMDTVLMNITSQDPAREELLEDAINGLNDRRTFIVTPAGDKRVNISTGVQQAIGGEVPDQVDLLAETLPANYENTLSVSALNSGEIDEEGVPEGLASFSNFGENIDVTAPGVLPPLQEEKGKPKSWQGTGVAASLVTGTSAILSAALKEQHIIDESSSDNLTKQVDVRANLFSKFLNRTGTYPSDCRWKHDPDDVVEPMVNVDRAIRRTEVYPRSITQHELIWKVLLSAPEESKLITVGGFRDDGSILSLLFAQSHFPKTEDGKPMDMSFFGWGDVEEIKEKIREEYNGASTSGKENSLGSCRKQSNIVVFAHGLGASTALKASQELAEEGIQIQSLITIDGVHHVRDTFLKSMEAPNVNHWVNLHLQQTIVDLVPAIPGIGHLARSVLSLTELINIPAKISIDTAKDLEDEIDDLTEADDAAREALQRIWEVITSKEERSDTLATIGGKWGSVDGADENYRVPEDAGKHHINPWEMFEVWVESHFQHKPVHEVGTSQ